MPDTFVVYSSGHPKSNEWKNVRMLVEDVCRKKEGKLAHMLPAQVIKHTSAYSLCSQRLHILVNNEDQLSSVYDYMSRLGSKDVPDEYMFKEERQAPPKAHKVNAILVTRLKDFSESEREREMEI